MLRVKFFISAKKAKESNLLVRFFNSNLFDVTAKTGIQFNPDFWSHKKGSVLSSFPASEKLQKKIESLEVFIKSEYDALPDKTRLYKTNGNRAKEWLNDTIERFNNPGKYEAGKNDLFAYIQNFVAKSKTRINPKTGNPVSYKMRREYEVTFDYLKQFADSKKKYYDFADIDLEFYNDFVAYLTDEGLAVNTVGKKIQTLKIFLNDATEQGVNKTLKFKSKNFKTLKEESDSIYLNVVELTQFYNHDFSQNKRLERVRDTFIVGCWTGLRFSDLAQVTPDRIKGDRIELRQSKTGKKVIIPVHPTTKEILHKYNNVLPEPISNQNFNGYLKEAAKLAGLNSVFIKSISRKGMKTEKKYYYHEIISSHTARRSFCTNLYEMGVPTLSIMAISGHRTEQAFLKYIKVSPEKHASIVMQVYNSKLRIAN
jgi:integrase